VEMRDGFCCENRSLQGGRVHWFSVGGGSGFIGETMIQTDCIRDIV
jgi:hypothetical protein